MPRGTIVLPAVTAEVAEDGTGDMSAVRGMEVCGAIVESGWPVGELPQGRDDREASDLNDPATEVRVDGVRIARVQSGVCDSNNLTVTLKQLPVELPVGGDVHDRGGDVVRERRKGMRNDGLHARQLGKLVDGRHGHDRRNRLVALPEHHAPFFANARRDFLGALVREYRDLDLLRCGSICAHGRRGEQIVHRQSRCRPFSEPRRHLHRGAIGGDLLDPWELTDRVERASQQADEQRVTRERVVYARARAAQRREPLRLGRTDELHQVVGASIGVHGNRRGGLRRNRGTHGKRHGTDLNGRCLEGGALQPGLLDCLALTFLGSNEDGSRVVGQDFGAAAGNRLTLRRIRNGDEVFLCH